MRRVVLAFAVCLGVQLIRPTPVQAWWGWWDELSGPKFWGLEIETRLVCFGGEGEEEKERERERTFIALLVSARRQVQFAFDSFNKVQNDLPSGVDRRPETVGALATLVVSVMALTPRHLTDAARLGMDASKLAGQIAEACPQKIEGCASRINTLKLVQGTLQQLATTLASVPVRQQENLKPEFLGSAGVALSACPFAKDEKRRASIDLTYRSLWARGGTKADFAGGNELRMMSLTPGVSWRPLMGMGTAETNWWDWVDLGAGAGIYWITSDGARPGGFETITGMILEPIRIDSHVPSAVASNNMAGVRLLSAASFRIGWAIFPAGFEENAFGTTQKPEQSKQIMGEWVFHWGVFFDPIRAVHLWKNR
jgi:hypothetical protein